MKTAAWDFVSTHAEIFGIKRICRVLEVSRSGYYRWITGAEARAGRQFEEDALVEEIREIHASRPSHSHSTAGPAKPSDGRHPPKPSTDTYS
ncbi:hypothetical protein ACVWZD_007164 [Streptomyces sp. TE3672]